MSVRVLYRLRTASSASRPSYTGFAAVVGVLRFVVAVDGRRLSLSCGTSTAGVRSAERERERSRLEQAMVSERERKETGEVGFVIGIETAVEGGDIDSAGGSDGAQGEDDVVRVGMGFADV